MKASKYSIHYVQLSQLMLNLYVVSRAVSFLRHAVHMLSVCVYYDLCQQHQLFLELEGCLPCCSALVKAYSDVR